METEPPDTPAMNAARAEAKDIATNHENPRYAGYQRGDREVSEYLDTLYAKALPTTTPEPQSLVLTTSEVERQAEAAQLSDDTHAAGELQAEWGDQYTARILDAEFDVSWLMQKLNVQVDDLMAAVLDAAAELTPEVQRHVGGKKFILRIASHWGKRAREFPC